MSSMKAAVLTGSRRVEIREHPIPNPGPGQVRVRLEGCGLCGSNLPVWQGREWFQYPLAPGAPGHEGWGEIDMVGPDVSGFKIGQRVTFMSHCAFAQYDVAEAASTVLLPESLAGRPVPGEPLACALNVARRSNFEPGQTVAIIGIGFLGALILDLAVKAGARVLALSRRSAAMEIAKQRGATDVISTENPYAAAQRILDLTNGRGCDTVVEAVGLQSALDLATDAVAESGRLIIAGFHQDGHRSIDLCKWNWRGISIVNAHERNAQIVTKAMQDAVSMIASGQWDPFALLTHSVSLDKLEDAMNWMEQRPGEFIKGYVKL